jgi:hypothetical protein
MIAIVLILQQHSKFHTITFLWHEVFSFNCPPTPKKKNISMLGTVTEWNRVHF